MRRSIYSLLIGGAFAVLALWAMFTFKPFGNGASASESLPMTTMFVAKQDIPYGDKIVADYVQEVQWPTAYVPKEAILTKAELLEGPDTPRIALRPIYAGEHFLRAKVSGFGERPILSRKVAEGMRAFTVRIDDISGVAGFILPGDRVDVLLTRSVSREGSEMATDVILQNITILGIDQVLSEEQTKPLPGKAATFEVTPEDAQKLALASQVGNLSLSLRNYETTDAAKVNRIDADDLTGRKAAPVQRVVRRAAPAPRADNGVYVTIRKGIQQSKEKVDR